MLTFLKQNSSTRTPTWIPFFCFAQTAASPGHIRMSVPWVILRVPTERFSAKGLCCPDNRQIPGEKSRFSETQNFSSLEVAMDGPLKSEEACGEVPQSSCTESVTCLKKARGSDRVAVLNFRSEVEGERCAIEVAVPRASLGRPIAHAQPATDIIFDIVYVRASCVRAREKTTPLCLDSKSLFFQARVGGLPRGGGGRARCAARARALALACRL